MRKISGMYAVDFACPCTCVYVCAHVVACDCVHLCVCVSQVRRWGYEYGVHAGKHVRLHTPNSLGITYWRARFPRAEMCKK